MIKQLNQLIKLSLG